MLAISLTEDIDVIVEKLNRFQPDLVTGYPSILAVLGKADRKGGFIFIRRQSPVLRKC